MHVFETVMCGFLILFAIFLVIAVLMQHGKDHKLSGTIAGGAENFFGKGKGQKVDRMLSRLTTIVSIVFVVIVLIVFILQPEVVYTMTTAESAPGAYSPYYDSEVIYPAETSETTEEETPTTTDASSTTAAE
ncbi:MAG: preprotein translocase subunit SecG [Eubacteriales bacterium]